MAYGQGQVGRPAQRRPGASMYLGSVGNRGGMNQGPGFQQWAGRANPYMGQPNRMWAGGNPNFDESTGRYMGGWRPPPKGAYGGAPGGAYGGGMQPWTPPRFGGPVSPALNPMMMQRQLAQDQMYRSMMNMLRQRFPMGGMGGYRPPGRGDMGGYRYG
jgi:hypothetical protein